MQKTFGLPKAVAFLDLPEETMKDRVHGRNEVRIPTTAAAPLPHGAGGSLAVAAQRPPLHGRIFA